MQWLWGGGGGARAPSGDSADAIAFQQATAELNRQLLRSQQLVTQYSASHDRLQRIVSLLDSTQRRALLHAAAESQHTQQQQTTHAGDHSTALTESSGSARSSRSAAAAATTAVSVSSPSASSPSASAQRPSAMMMSSSASAPASAATTPASVMRRAVSGAMAMTSTASSAASASMMMPGDMDASIVQAIIAALEDRAQLVDFLVRVSDEIERSAAAADAADAADQQPPPQQQQPLLLPLAVEHVDAAGDAASPHAPGDAAPATPAASRAELASASDTVHVSAIPTSAQRPMSVSELVARVDRNMSAVRRIASAATPIAPPPPPPQQQSLSPLRSDGAGAAAGMRASLSPSAHGPCEHCADVEAELLESEKALADAQEECSMLKRDVAALRMQLGQLGDGVGAGAGAGAASSAQRRADDAERRARDAEAKLAAVEAARVALAEQLDRVTHEIGVARSQRVPEVVAESVVAASGDASGDADGWGAWDNDDEDAADTRTAVDAPGAPADIGGGGAAAATDATATAAERDVSALRARVADLETELAAREQECVQLRHSDAQHAERAGAAAARAASLEAQIGQLSDSLAAREQECVQLRHSGAQHAERAGAAAARAASLEAQIAQLSDSLAAREQECVQLRQRSASLPRRDMSSEHADAVEQPDGAQPAAADQVKGSADGWDDDDDEWNPDADAGAAGAVPDAGDVAGVRSSVSAASAGAEFAEVAELQTRLSDLQRESDEQRKRSDSELVRMMETHARAEAELRERGVAVERKLQALEVELADVRAQLVACTERARELEDARDEVLRQADRQVRAAQERERAIDDDLHNANVHAVELQAALDNVQARAALLEQQLQERAARDTSHEGEASRRLAAVSARMFELEQELTGTLRLHDGASAPARVVEPADEVTDGWADDDADDAAAPQAPLAAEAVESRVQSLAHTLAERLRDAQRAAAHADERAGDAQSRVRELEQRLAVAEQRVDVQLRELGEAEERTRRAVESSLQETRSRELALESELEALRASRVSDAQQSALVVELEAALASARAESSRLLALADERERERAHVEDLRLREREAANEVAQVCHQRCCELEAQCNVLRSWSAGVGGVLEALDEELRHGTAMHGDAAAAVEQAVVAVRAALTERHVAPATAAAPAPAPVPVSGSGNPLSVPPPSSPVQLAVQPRGGDNVSPVVSSLRSGTPASAAASPGVVVVLREPPAGAPDRALRSLRACVEIVADVCGERAVAGARSFGDTEDELVFLAESIAASLSHFVPSGRAPRAALVETPARASDQQSSSRVAAALLQLADDVRAALQAAVDAARGRGRPHASPQAPPFDVTALIQELGVYIAQGEQERAQLRRRAARSESALRPLLALLAKYEDDQQVQVRAVLDALRAKQQSPARSTLMHRIDEWIASNARVHDELTAAASSGAAADADADASGARAVLRELHGRCHAVGAFLEQLTPAGAEGDDGCARVLGTLRQRVEQRVTTALEVLDA